jgi:hypothetical protein
MTTQTLNEAKPKATKKEPRTGDQPTSQPKEDMPPTDVRAPQEAHDVDTKLLGDLIDEIRQLAHDHENGLMQSLGQLILDRLFNGNVEEMKVDHAKNGTYQQLLDHEDLPDTVNRSTLSKSVRIVLQRAELKGEPCENLPPTHQAVLLSISEHGTKVQLGNQAAEENWSKNRLQEEVSKSRSNRKTTGRPSHTEAVKMKKSLEKWDETYPTNFSAETIAKMKPELKEELLELFTRSIERLQALCRQLRADEPVNVAT